MKLILKKLNNEIVINAKSLGLFVNDSELYKDLVILKRLTGGTQTSNR